MNKLVFSLLVLSGIVAADVKPANTLLSHRCGHVNRSERLCLLGVVGTKEVYVTTTMNERLGRVVPVVPKQVASGDEGPIMEYTGRFAEVNRDGEQGTVHSLKLRTAPKGDGTEGGTLEIDGKSDGAGYKGFTLEAQIHHDEKGWFYTENK